MVVLPEPEGQNRLEVIETLRSATKKEGGTLLKMLGMGVRKDVQTSPIFLLSDFLPDWPSPETSWQNAWIREPYNIKQRRVKAGDGSESKQVNR